MNNEDIQSKLKNQESVLDDDKNTSINSNIISENLNKISRSLSKDYLNELSSNYMVLPFSEYNTGKIGYETNIRAVKINKWVNNSKETIADKFENIFAVFAKGDNNIALVVNRTKEGADFYFVIKNETSKGISKYEESNSNLFLLESVIYGNFPGSDIRKVNLKSCIQDEEYLNEEFEKIDLFPNDDSAIMAVSNIVSEKSKEFISQGLEKLLDGIVPFNDQGEDSYTIIFIAEPINNEQLKVVKNGYEEMGTEISPYCQYQHNISRQDSKNISENSGLSKSKGVNSAITKTFGMNAGLEIPNIPIKIGVSSSKSKTNGEFSSDTESSGVNYGVSSGVSDGTTYTFKNYSVTNLLKKIEQQIERVDLCEALGMWKYATYVMSQDSKTAINVANVLCALSQGEKSNTTPAFINGWHNQKDENFINIKQYITAFTHPIFINNVDCIANGHTIDLKNVAIVTHTNYVSTKELAEVMVFPKKSVAGLPVIECVEFGRNVAYRNVSNSNYEKSKIHLGVIHHMQHDEVSKVNLDIDSLSKHTFITGSTGSGKSTAIYKILSELEQQGKKFLVIEPAKGEYKYIFHDVAKIYGTNHKKNVILQINPFKFPSEDILVNEHIDRLIEIFNVCWPMYAAMPAVLKDAVEKAYISAGWDLNTSENNINEALFPSFTDVLKQLHIVINQSDFSAEVKSNYIGSLVTRVKSLTNGIYGQIFGCNDIGDKQLFDENVIVDLSRVGSLETKAMIMGILVMKLQEYRMSSNKMNQDLHHVTVIEEAHNLLKRTSAEQSSEGSNLLGKSVEMLSNAIAEMRTYGEGFIIADQSPGLMDMSVIRNTNTKIILGLPDLSDRELVGKAVGLNDEQIIELARLQTGVAAVYQNNWISPVLCRVEPPFDRVTEDKKQDSYSDEPSCSKFYEGKLKAEIINLAFNNNFKTIDLTYGKIKELEVQIMNSNIPVYSKICVLSHLKKELPYSPIEKIDIIKDIYYTDLIKYKLIDSEKQLKSMLNSDSKLDKILTEPIFQQWLTCIDNSMDMANQEYRNIIIGIIIQDMTLNNIRIDQCIEVFNQWRG